MITTTRQTCSGGSDPADLAEKTCQLPATRTFIKAAISPLPGPIVPALGSKTVTFWRQAYRNYRLGGAAGAVGRASALWQRGTSKRLAFASLFSHKEQLRATAVWGASEGRVSSLSSDRSDAAADGSPQVSSASEGGEEENDPWEALEKTQALLSEYRLAYRRHRIGGSVGAKGELADLVASLDRAALRLLPAAQVASLRRSRDAAGFLPRGASLLGLADDRFHVHFGAGKLGLGLVIPSVAESGTPFAVVQRPSAAFEPLTTSFSKEPAASTSDEVLIEQAVEAFVVTERAPSPESPPVVALTINGVVYPGSSLALVTCLRDLPPSWEKWLTARDRTYYRGEGGNERRGSVPPPAGLAPQGLFVCGSDPALAALVVGAASSFSTSLGPGLSAIAGAALLGAMPTRPEPRDRPGLFACENDHAAVEDLAKGLDGRVHVVSCMVDRICTGREVRCTTAPGGSGSGPLRSVNVACERYGGQVVVLSKPAAVRAPPFAGDHVLVPRATAEADYLCRRKLLLVNGSHTTLAFMSLAQAAPAGSTEKVVLAEDKLRGCHAALPLVTSASATPAQRRALWCWAAARILLLLFEWDLEVVQSAHGVDTPEAAVGVLVDFAKEALGRFDAAEDTCGRVLGGGVTARFYGRLLPVKSFLDDTWGDTTKFPDPPINIVNIDASRGAGRFCVGSAAEAGASSRSAPRSVWFPEDERGEPHPLNPHDGCGGGVFKLEKTVSDATVGGQGLLTMLVLRACGVSKREVAAAVRSLTNEASRFVEPSDALG